MLKWVSWCLAMSLRYRLLLGADQDLEWTYEQFYNCLLSNISVILNFCHPKSDQHFQLACMVVYPSRGWKGGTMAENIWTSIPRNICTRFSELPHECALMPLFYPYELEGNFMVSLVFRPARAFHYKGNLLFERSQRWLFIAHLWWSAEGFSVLKPIVSCFSQKRFVARENNWILQHKWYTTNTTKMTNQQIHTHTPPPAKGISSLQTSSRQEMPYLWCIKQCTEKG